MTLTREEIQALPPGRELDALVAHYVFGWNILADGRMESQDKFVIRSVPEYSTDISAAWEVVTHLKSKYWYFMLSDENEGWEASFYWDPHRPAFEAVSSDAPEAICKAALLAVLKL